MAEQLQGRLKSSWTEGSAPLLCVPVYNSGALPPVNGLFKRPSCIGNVHDQPTGCIWLRIGTSGGPLWRRKWTFRFH